MSDVYLGLAIMVTISLVVLLLTVRLTRPLSKRATTGIGFLGAILLGLYLTCLWQSSVLVTVLPSTSIIVLSNWFTIAAAFLAGITWTHGYGSRRRRVLFGGVLFVMSGWSVIEPLVGSVPHCANLWDQHGVCRQSSPTTCTPAAAATLLSLYGIPAEESELAELCLTRRPGTTWQGLYRGLVLKTEALPYDVEVRECDWEELAASLDEPAIIACGLERGEPYPEIYTKKWGWQPGVRHSVVVVRRLKQDRVLIADPSVGLESWTLGELQTLYRGRVVRLRNTDGETWEQISDRVQSARRNRKQKPEGQSADAS